LKATTIGQMLKLTDSITPFLSHEFWRGVSEFIQWRTFSGPTKAEGLSFFRVDWVSWGEGFRPGLAECWTKGMPLGGRLGKMRKFKKKSNQRIYMQKLNITTRPYQNRAKTRSTTEVRTTLWIYWSHFFVILNL